MSGEASAAGAFSRHASVYDATRTRLVPCLEPLYGAVVDVLGLQAEHVGRALDLGAGTGLLSAKVLAAHPHVKLELLDGSEEMLARAQTRLGTAVCELRLGDLRERLPDGPFDAIVSALAIHHLDDQAKRDLFARVRAQLRPGGAFVNADQVVAPVASLSSVYDEVWERHCRLLGATDEELTDARARMRYDDCAPIEAQLGWLRATGFVNVDCVFKSWRFAVMAAWRPAA